MILTAYLLFIAYAKVCAVSVYFNVSDYLYALQCHIWMYLAYEHDLYYYTYTALLAITIMVVQLEIYTATLICCNTT